jgi:hypothetical protein
MITFKQFLAEISTIPQLDMKARQAFPHTKKRQNDVGSVVPQPNMAFTPNVPKNELTIDTRTRSSNTGDMHNQRVILYKVNFTQPGQGTQLPNLDAAIEPVQLNSETSRVACDCMDFRFRFANNNAKDDSLAGNPPPAYQRVPGSNRPEANPSHLPGMCKHLMRIIQQLKQQKIVI